MKKITAFIVVLMFFATIAKAQYVTIPDSSFRAFLKSKFPGCFNSAGKMDTTCFWLTTGTRTIDCSNSGIKNLYGIQYFKKLLQFNCSNNLIDSIVPLPSSIVNFECSNNKLAKLPPLPSDLRSLICRSNLLDSLPLLNDSLWRVDFANNKINKLEKLPKLLNYLDCSHNSLDSLPDLPNAIKTLYCFNNNLASLPKLSDSLIDLRADSNKLLSLPSLPSNLLILYCNYNKIVSLPQLPYKMKSLKVNFNIITSLPALPVGLESLTCDSNLLTQLPSLPDSLNFLSCSNNKLSALPTLNSKLAILQCPYNFITTLPNLPASISSLNITNNKLTQLPSLPRKIKSLSIGNNQLAIIPSLGDSLRTLHLGGNLGLSCLPFLPSSLKILSVKNTNIQCFPNIPTNLNSNLWFPNLPICNSINNSNQCKPFPQIRAKVFVDGNWNGLKDSTEFARQHIKISLSNKNYTYTNSKGEFQIATDSLGAFTLAITPPPFYTAVPSTINLNFSRYDTIINLPEIALQANTLIDSLIIKATPLNFAARPGFKYAYKVQYENIGTTVISPNIHFNYDNTLLSYDSCSSSSVTNSGSNLTLSVTNLLPGQTGSFVVYFRVKTTAALGTLLLSVANITGGISNATDSVKTIIRGSYDPNDKQATPSLTLQNVADGYYIDYTIRFQNTGTDTAFNIVISDTLSAMLEANNLQMVASSHPCKTTIKNNKVYFEFFDIYLPDSATNKVSSNGFVTFKVKPISTVTAGTIIPNKAYIYFDYNKSIITNIANTTIIHTVPLKLVNFNAISKEDKTVLVYWNTVNEINTSHFILEQSVNSKDFYKLAQVEAKGFGSNSYSYSLNFDKTSFLRLKIVDKDGSVAYSNIIKVSKETDTNVSVLPNPAKNYFDINTHTEQLNNTDAVLFNSLGISVKTFKLHLGTQRIKIDDLSAGFYYLKTALQSIKILVEK